MDTMPYRNAQEPAHTRVLVRQWLAIFASVSSAYALHECLGWLWFRARFVGAMFSPRTYSMFEQVHLLLRWCAPQFPILMTLISVLARREARDRVQRMLWTGAVWMTVSWMVFVLGDSWMMWVSNPPYPPTQSTMQRGASTSHLLALVVVAVALIRRETSLGIRVSVAIATLARVAFIATGMWVESITNVPERLAAYKWFPSLAYALVVLSALAWIVAWGLARRLEPETKEPRSQAVANEWARVHNAALWMLVGVIAHHLFGWMIYMFSKQESLDAGSGEFTVDLVLLFDSLALLVLFVAVCKMTVAGRSLRGQVLWLAGAAVVMREAFQSITITARFWTRPTLWQGERLMHLNEWRAEADLWLLFVACLVLAVWQLSTRVETLQRRLQAMGVIALIVAASRKSAVLMHSFAFNLVLIAVFSSLLWMLRESAKQMKQTIEDHVANESGST